MLVLKDGTTVDTIGGGVLEQHVIADATSCLASGVSRSERYELRPEGEHALGAVCGGEVEVFLDVHLPERTLVIVGAGHVGQSLCRCAKLLDRRVVVVDPREDMVTAERLPEADQLVCGIRGAWPSSSRSGRAPRSSSSPTVTSWTRRRSEPRSALRRRTSA